MDTTYYKNELNILNNDASCIVKLKSNTGNTKWLSLNDESATELVQWLKKHYKIQPTIIGDDLGRPVYSND